MTQSNSLQGNSVFLNKMTPLRHVLTFLSMKNTNVTEVRMNNRGDVQVKVEKLNFDLSKYEKTYLDGHLYIVEEGIQIVESEKTLIVHY